MKYVVKEKDGGIILTNCGGSLDKTHERTSSHSGKIYEFHLKVENEDEKRSSRLRKTFFEVLENTTINFLESETKRFNKYNHIVRTISEQLSQKVDGYFGDKKWYSNNYVEALNNIESILLENTNETRKLIHYFNKISIDLKNHIEGWEIIYIKDNYVPDFSQVSLRKAILNQFSSFAEEFDDLNIKMRFSDHFSDEYTVALDKKLFSLVMYNFFSNTLKYSLPEEEIRLNYSDEKNQLDVSMYSARIEKSELPNIFDDGVRGVHANKFSSSGSGQGLFVVKKALGLMRMSNMHIDPQYAKIKSFNDTVFVENHFIFDFKRHD